jgi:hypothetical protein
LNKYIPPAKFNAITVKEINISNVLKLANVSGDFIIAIKAIIKVTGMPKRKQKEIIRTSTRCLFCVIVKTLLRF